MRISALVVVGSVLASPALASAQTVDQAAFGVDRWCADSGTLCWNDNEAFTGIRFIAEISPSFLFQSGTNRFEGGVSTLPKFAVELNLLRSWISLQLALIGPSSVTLDSKSPARAQLVDTLSGQVAVDWGLTGGLAFFDSAISLGWGHLEYDRRDFTAGGECTRIERESQESLRREIDELADSRSVVDSRRARTLGEELRTSERSCYANTGDGFWYLAFQPVATLRASLKDGGSTEPTPPENL